MTLTQVVEEYVTVKRSTGLRFKNGAMILRTFTRVAGAIEVSDVTQNTVRAFLKKSGPITSGWHQKHYTLAGFFRFAMQRGLVSTSPVAYRLPKRPAYATPYIYSAEELRRMLDATSALDRPHPKNGQPATIPALTFRTLILLLYGAGLRLGEALAFTVDDVDLPANMLVVRNTKFFKTRLVPIGPRLSSALHLYADTRLAVIRRPPTRDAFLLRRDGIPISLYTAERYFRILRSRIGIRRSDRAYFQPRLHDLRHSFAVHRLVAWYRQGADVQLLLPKLSTYLGHISLAETQHYLTMTPDLLREAGRRFENLRRSGGPAMINKNLVAPWVRRFLLEHVVADLNLSRNTQASYRDAMTLLLPFAAKQQGQPIDQLEIEHLAPDVVRRFLAHLEDERHCSVSTRNQRLAAIHAFARFIGTRSPEHLAWCAELTAIPIKKAAKGTLPYLEKQEMDALLAALGRRTSQGARDHALLLFLYNAGARADEAARLTVADLDLGTSPAAKLLGKGNKTRLCPLWPSTAGVLKTLVATRGGREPVFLNRRHEAITRFGIYDLVKRHAARAAQRVPSIAAKRVSPHVIRHTTAVYLLRAGVDINTIRAWLGHVSLDTINIYAEVDLAMKAKALGECSIPADSRRHWRKEPGLMAFLRSL